MEANSVKQLLDLKRDKQWEDWRFQLRMSPKTVEEFYGFLPDLAATLNQIPGYQNGISEEISSLSGQFQFGTTPYYLDLINPEDPEDPVLRQILPDLMENKDEIFFDLDPLKEDEHSPVPGIVHRYPDRVLLYTTERCAVYCRFCTRKRKLLEEDPSMDRPSAMQYIRGHSEIKEAILSGGDPLFQSDNAIEEILSELKKIDHIKSIRIHSRIPVVLPMRFTQKLLGILENSYPITLVSHFNHSREITEDTFAMVKKLRMAGVLVLNQTVLLKGINDSGKEQKELQMKLLETGIKPYYLHQCDEVKSVSHFRTSVEKGEEIMNEMWGSIPGIAVPRYVIDLPEGGGKRPLF